MKERPLQQSIQSVRRKKIDIRKSGRKRGAKQVNMFTV
jgi:hypothetical protein